MWFGLASEGGVTHSLKENSGVNREHISRGGGPGVGATVVNGLLMGDGEGVHK